ncbi:MAG: T9SS type A sorting domain-containing protein [Bacteroidia bacterium]|nr:T9SS type A sorting domain-containing protein [Bacteroidia bacterium]
MTSTFKIKYLNMRCICYYLSIILLSMITSEIKAITGNGTAESPYLIANTADLNEFKNKIDNDNSNYRGKNWKLTNDINWTGASGTNRRIGYADRSFSGVFDGDGHKITIEFIDDKNSQWVGFFGQADWATIINFTLEYGYINSGGKSGGLIGEVKNNITIENVHVIGTGVSNVHDVLWGGLIGYIYDGKDIYIKKSTVNINSVVLHDNSYSYFDAGGLVGKIENNSRFVNISDCVANVNISVNPSSNIDTSIGGIIGSVSKPISLIRCYSGSNILGAGKHYRGYIVGYLADGGSLFARNVFNKFGNAYVGYRNSGGYDVQNMDNYANWLNEPYVYNLLERKNDTGGDIAGNLAGNQTWGFASDGTPKVSSTSYAVKIRKGTNIGTITGQKLLVSNDVYANADDQLTIKPSVAISIHQRVIYSFTPDYNHKDGDANNFSATQTGNDWKLTARVNGTVNARIENIPYPQSLTAAFDQWNTKVTLSWNAANPNNIAGKWYIYKRIQNSGSVYTRHDGQSVSNGTANYKYDVSLATSELEKNWEYVVCFVENNTTVPSSPIANNSATVIKATNTSVSFTLTAEGLDNHIKLLYKVPTQMDGVTSYKYTILRKKTTDGSYVPILSNRTFVASEKNSLGFYTYTDNEPTSACDRYLYKIDIDAFSKTFTQEITNNVGISGSSKITNANASKGEYSGYVRITWSTSKLNVETLDRFRIFRKVATNENDQEIEIATIDTKDANSVYVDNNILPGVYYEYNVVLYQTCGTKEAELMRQKSIGFSQSLGSVSGRITYGNGQAVKGVNVSVLRNDLQGNETQYNSLESKGEGGTLRWETSTQNFTNLFTNDFSFQFWINPAASNTANNIFVADIKDVATVRISPISNNYYLSIQCYNTSNSIVSTSSTNLQIEPNRFSHVAVTRRDNMLKLYLVNDKDLSNIRIDSVTISNARKNFTPTANNCFVIMGNAFKGYIDETRIWNKALSSATILQDYNRMLIGNEEGLKAYWTFDEGLPGQFFDISKVGTVFNGNHGTTNLTSSKIIPTNEQLALKAITDADGNYQIRGIPFSGEGCSYDIIPSLGVHKFNPTRQLRYISNASLVHNNTDFTNISSFTLSGKVTYKGGTYPVEGCTFEIDDQIVVAANGEAVKSDANGLYSISVPIGEHKVRIKKSGHIFTDDGLLLDAVTRKNMNFFKNETADFVDETTVKLIGRIVGGSKENEKNLGFGESLNNIGAETIMLTATKSQYNLKNSQTSETVTHNNGEWKKPGGLQNDQTTVVFNQKDIKITVSPVSGEFVAYVYPELYTIGKIENSNYSSAFFNGGESLDLTTAAVPTKNMMRQSIRTWTDSVLVSAPGMVDYYQKIEKSDTVFYHEKWTHYYQATPTFSVVQADNGQQVNYFGEKTYRLKNSNNDFETINLATSTGETENYLFGKPVFVQGKEYELRFAAYEEYKNFSTNITTKYPVANGTVNITNSIANSAPQPLKLDETGKAVYRFLAGAPDLTTATGTFMGTVQIGSLSYYWDRGNQPIAAWHLGDKSTGTDFMTAGPNQITAILRDPPGSLSSAYIEAGSSVKVRHSYTKGVGANTDINLTTSLGPSVTTFVGLGAGVITTTEVKLDASAGLKTETKLSSGLETEATTTFTERFETSDDPLYVGANGDVFIGNSTNILYGLTNGISIQKNYSGTEFSSNGVYSIAPTVSLAYGQSFDTRFAFSQVEIENIMIPKWKDNLALLIKKTGTTVNTSTITHPVYVSKLPHDDENFGKLNTDSETFGTLAVDNNRFDDGPSYKIYYPVNYNKVDFKVDSVMWYNNQINGWIAVLEQNEKEKVEMTKLGNYSFGSGASIMYSKSASTSKIYTTTFNSFINPSIGVVTGGEVMGIGLEFSMQTEFVNETNSEDSEQTENTVSSGFTLKEEGDDDEITVDYGMTTSGTIAFKTRGGRTSCPYEDVVISKYFEPGQHILSEATMQIEVPKISIAGSDQALAVPANRTAKFTLEMKNESQTNEDVWFQLVVDESTNPYGAELKIDGAVIGNGRMFLVKAGEVLRKVLTVGKGTADVYENIALVLRSECQSDPTDFLPDIADTVRVKRIEFVPSCSEVAIKEPMNNWIVNTISGDTLDVVLEGYDINFVNFGYVQLEYRSLSETTWTTLTKFYGNVNIYNKAQGDKTLIPLGTQRIRYQWNQRSMPDGAYEIRAKAVCVNVDNNYNIIQQISEFTTDVVAGRKDTNIPQVLGNPSPTNGILYAGDEISLTFNEDIRTGLLTYNNFSVKGILNGNIIAEPAGGLAMNGTDFAYTEAAVFSNNSFSIETWFKRQNNSEGTLFAYGTADNIISLGFNMQGQAVVSIGDETYTSTQSISNTTQTWKYVGLSYNRTNKTLSVYAWQDSDPTIKLFENKTFSKMAPTQGRLYSGAKNDGSNGFVGAVAMMHFYDYNRSDTEMSAAKGETKSGTENGLVGLWPMKEGEGLVARDIARTRNMITNGSWYVYPAGKSIALNGTSQFGRIPATNCVFSPYDDFSIELWFKAENQSEATMFAIGTSMNIGFDATKRIVLNTSKGSQILVTDNLMDNQWHHFALTVKRKGSSNVLIDGKVVSTFSTANIFENSVGGGFCYLGARYSENAQTAVPVYDRYFKGNIDELRIWNNALNTGNILRNKNNKLSGAENGLLAYYPFEKWTRNTNGTYNVVDWKKDIMQESLEMTGSAVISLTAVGLQDVRPLKEVAHTFTSSNNKIVINITEELYKTEGVTLEISAKEIYDMNDNISKPISWVAYVNINQLNWSNTQINLNMQENEKLSFDAAITNSGALRTDYFIENIPDWLSLTDTQGSLQPLTSKILTFNVLPQINIGTYEASIVLTGTNNVRKILSIRLRVTGTRPDWSVNLNNFENSMNITGKILVNNRPKEDTSDILAAFIGDKCIGVTSPVYVGSNNAYFTFADIYGNASENDKTITFKLWEASTGRIYPEISTSNPNITFVPNQILGNVNAPIIFNAADVVEQSIPLKKGWSWISTNITHNAPDVLTQMKNSLLDVGVLIKGRSTYIQQPGWVGTLNAVSEKSMYVINTNIDHNLILKGTNATPESTTIDITNGWNWISYVPNFSTSLKNALAGLNATVGDQIKAQSGYASYTGANGWIGSLTFMQPGKGYMYYSANNTTHNFVYPSSLSQRVNALRAKQESQNRWQANESKFAGSMTITAIVIHSDAEIRSDQIELAAFSGNECRGTVMLQYVESLDKYMGFLMVYGENNDDISLRIFDHNANQEIAVNNVALRFATDAMHGSPNNPYQVNTGTTGITDNLWLNEITLYPNPVIDNLQVIGSWDVIDLLEITDMSGRLILKEYKFSKSAINVSALESGMYILKITKDKNSKMIKFIKH